MSNAAIHQRMGPAAVAGLQKKQVQARKMLPGTVAHRVATRQVARHVGSLIHHLVRSPHAKKSAKFKGKTIQGLVEERDEDSSEVIESLQRVTAKKKMGEGEGGGGFEGNLEEGHKEILDYLTSDDPAKTKENKENFKKIWLDLLTEATSGQVSTHSFAKRIKATFGGMDEYGFRVVCEHLQDQFLRLGQKERLSKGENLLIEDIEKRGKSLDQVINKALESLEEINTTILPTLEQQAKATFGGLLEEGLSIYQSLFNALEKDDLTKRPDLLRKGLFQMIGDFSEKGIDEIMDSLESLISSEGGWEKLEMLAQLTTVMIEKMHEEPIIETKEHIVLNLLLNAKNRLKGIRDVKYFFTDEGYRTLLNCLKQEGLQPSSPLEPLEEEIKPIISSWKRYFDFTP